MSERYLRHHGIRFQKWGVRNYQNPDGSLTPEGRIRYGVGAPRDKKEKSMVADISELTNDELRSMSDRYKIQSDYYYNKNQYLYNQKTYQQLTAPVKKDHKLVNFLEKTFVQPAGYAAAKTMEGVYGVAFDSFMLDMVGKNASSSISTYYTKFLDKKYGQKKNNKGGGSSHYNNNNQGTKTT